MVIVLQSLASNFLRISVIICIQLDFVINCFTYFKNFSSNSKIVELEEELRVVGNNLKSLEVSEEKVSMHNFCMNI